MAILESLPEDPSAARIAYQQLAGLAYNLYGTGNYEIKRTGLAVRVTRLEPMFS